MLKAHLFVVFAVALALVSCSSMKNNSTEARAELEDELKNWVGSATKADLTEKLGKPEWCKQEVTGSETCRFMVELGTEWRGTKKFQKSYTRYDEVLATFSPNEALESYKVRSQR